jgi:hypothetical protein
MGTQAAFAAQTNTTRLGDLNFFQKKSTIYWTTQFTQTDQKYKNTYDVGNNSFIENKNSTLNWENRVLYGLTDSLNVGASFNYDIRNKTKNDQSVISGAQQFPNGSYEETGVSDLTLNANYRLLREKIYLDLIGALTLGIGDHETGSATATQNWDGNNKQGHHSLLMGVAAGQKISDFEWRAMAFLDYHLSGQRMTHLQNNNKFDVDTDSYSVMGLDLRGQYRFLKKFAVAANLGFNRASDYTESGNTNGTHLDVTRDSYNYFLYGLTGKYNVSETILAKVGVQMQSAHDIKGSNTQTLNPKISTKIANETATSLFLGGEFLF